MQKDGPLLLNELLCKHLWNAFEKKFQKQGISRGFAIGSICIKQPDTIHTSSL